MAGRKKATPVAAPASKPKARKKAGEFLLSTPIAPKTDPRPRGGVDRRTAQKLKRGQMAIDARLDLHGLTQAQAHERLRQFILHAYRAGHRCVLVITGKGGIEGKGVLRRMVPQWLEEAPLAKTVLSVTAARPKDGGEGALYVYVRRRRTSEM
ncbi:MAG: Smr/MutS family protein [Alphaproteobacteria bacterium]|nr:Smr/MutS family protein [Alphaproteobacteria bacterium]